MVSGARDRGLDNANETVLLSAYGMVDADVLSAQLRLHALYLAVWRAHRLR